MRAAGFDYFENSRRAALAQRGYGAANPMGWRGYDENVWGWTACDGPGGGKLTYKGETREFRTYSARGVSGNHPFDDGTIAPTAALGSIAFVPEEATAAAEAMVARYGRRLYRSEEHTSELQSLIRISYAVICLTKKKQHRQEK